jgi:hypothetical protein
MGAHFDNTFETQHPRVKAMLQNPRRERFAQLLASGKTAKDAYALAGYRASGSNGA